ncbi:MAG: TetR/AcrR family transcriptional regulator [Coriobacteriales bacterium]|nr:TetR/AcrR family transcriptional regulator [Coriobacteriales bacterium]
MDEKLDITQAFRFAIAGARDYSAFERIEAEKRQRILQAAYQEFTVCDFAQASTNVIVKTANISKGLLFHYFGDKSGLYRYLLANTIGLMTVDLQQSTDFTGGDVFDLLKQTVESKLKTACQYPRETAFLVRAVLDKTLPEDLAQLIGGTVANSYDMMATLTSQLDAELLKPGLDRQQACKIIYYVCEGLSNDVLKDISPEIDWQDWRNLTSEVEEYFELLRQLFYR